LKLPSAKPQGASKPKEVIDFLFARFTRSKLRGIRSLWVFSNLNDLPEALSSTAYAPRTTGQGAGVSPFQPPL